MSTSRCERCGGSLIPSQEGRLCPACLEAQRGETLARPEALSPSPAASFAHPAQADSATILKEEGAKIEPRLKRVSAWTDLVKNIVQIVAIFGAAIWALYRFEYSERPSLDKRLQVRSHPIEWFEAPDNRAFCMGKFGITVKNVSKRLVSIDSIKVSVWTVPFPEDEAGKPATYINPGEIAKGTPAEARPIVKGSLIGTYGPDIEAEDDYVYKMRRAPGQITLFQFEAKGEGGAEWRDWQWAYACGELAPATPAAKPSTPARPRRTN